VTHAGTPGRIQRRTALVSPSSFRIRRFWTHPVIHPIQGAAKSRAIVRHPPSQGLPPCGTPSRRDPSAPRRPWAMHRTPKRRGSALAPRKLIVVTSHLGGSRGDISLSPDRATTSVIHWTSAAQSPTAARVRGLIPGVPAVLLAYRASPGDGPQPARSALALSTRQASLPDAPAAVSERHRAERATRPGASLWHRPERRVAGLRPCGISSDNLARPARGPADLPTGHRLGLAAPQVRTPSGLAQRLTIAHLVPVAAAGPPSVVVCWLVVDSQRPARDTEH
jgi:hypothetical protein